MNRTACFFAGVALASFAPAFVSGFVHTDAPRVTALVEDETADKAEVQARKHKKVLVLLESMNQKEITQSSLDASLETFTEMGLPDSFKSCFKENFRVDHVMEFTAEIYTERLEESTIDALITFFETDEGKAYTKAMPDITLDGLKKGTEYGKTVGEECAKGR